MYTETLKRQWHGGETTRDVCCFLSLGSCIDLVGLSPGDPCALSKHNKKSKPYLIEFEETFPKGLSLPWHNDIFISKYSYVGHGSCILEKMPLLLSIIFIQYFQLFSNSLLANSIRTLNFSISSVVYIVCVCACLLLFFVFCFCLMSSSVNLHHRQIVLHSCVYVLAERHLLN